VGQAKGLWRWWLRKISPLAILNDDGFEISNGNIIIIIIIITEVETKLLFLILFNFIDDRSQVLSRLGS
jgi:hypothetical protein